MRLRSIVRHVESLSVQSAQNQNRLHAAQGSASTPGCIVQDLKRSVASLELRIHKLRREDHLALPPIDLQLTLEAIELFPQSALEAFELNSEPKCKQRRRKDA
jgi:hypothetical protein